ncbi:MAG: hypothetical protein ABIO70_37180 [Pseudomonadota bacterium]
MLVRVCGRRAVLFNVVDDHLHLVAQCDESDLGHLCRSVLLALHPLTEVPFAPVYIKPVTDRGHLGTLVRYVLEQGPHHGLPVHPALAVGSCFADLIGARVLPGFEQRLPRLLPRFRLRSAFAAVGMRLEQPLAPANDDALATAGAARIRAACAFALAAPPDLPGREAWVVDARAAFVQLAHAAGLPTRVIAQVGDMPPRTVQFLGHRAVSPPLLAAARLRIALEDAVHTLPSLAREPEPPVYGEAGPQEPGEESTEPW